jgi:oligopeptide/dipeptide ABC transporter ATP-binding protein
MGRLPSIPGVVPSLIGARAGCSFRDRCAFAVDACAGGEIPIGSGGERHDYRCVHTPIENRASRSRLQDARP